MLKAHYQFENLMSPLQTKLGLFYLPMHYFVLPLLLGLLATYVPGGMDEVRINLIYYAIGIVFVLLVMMNYLKESYYVLMDRLGYCLLTLFMAMGLDYILSYAVTAVFAVLGDSLANPNNEQVMNLADVGYGSMKAIAIFLAPIVEEVLFRGVVFGMLRPHKRVLAYVFSIALFAVYHIWQYVAVTGDWSLYIYALQYIPVSFVLAWCYDRTGTIWTPIFFHMLINAMSFYALDMMEMMA